MTEFLAGTITQGGIVRRWNAAGLFTSEDGKWGGPSVRSTLLRPALAGRIEWVDEESGEDRFSYFTDDPIIDEATWHRLCAKILGRRRGRPRGEMHVASGLLKCSEPLPT